MKKLLWSLGINTVVALIVALTVVLSGRSKAILAAAENKPVPVQVNIDNFSFNASTLTVPAGTTVTWTNKDDVPHNIVSTDKLFASPVLDTGEKFSYTFAKSGTYPYYCSIHPKMTAKIVVE